MKHRSILPFRRRRDLNAGLVAVAVSAFAVAVGAAEPDRAPSVDTQCPWGRLGDGRGRFVRCITSEEAARLREPAPPPARPPAEGTKPPAPGAVEAPKPPSLSAVAPAEAPKAGGEASSAIWPLPPPKAAESVPPAVPPPPPEPELVAEIGPAVADSGALSDSHNALKKARDRVVECAEKNGGITTERAEVELRFLVQERGRAEGVSLKKRKGLGDAAAKCIADVVDRRFVGYPDEPAVGATLVVTITKKKK